MRALIFAAMLAAIGASGASAETVPQPTPADAAVEITGRAGQKVEAQEGANIAVELQTSPSTGGRWTASAKPDFLEAAGVQTPPVNAGELRGPPGQVWQTFTVTINAQ